MLRFFHRKAAKVAKERKEVGKSGEETGEEDGKSCRNILAR
jgi:hypothetical protein